MPGLVFVRSATGRGEELVRRAAAQLERRPWERVAIRSDPRWGIALAHVGTRGGFAVDADGSCTAVVDGEIFTDAPVSGDAAAELVLRAYAKGGIRTDLPDGSFAAVVRDGRSRRTVAFTDRYASRPIYVAQAGDDIVVGGELKAVVASGLRPRVELEPQAVAEFLSYEHWLPGRTLLKGISAVRPASALVVDDDSTCDTYERWRYRLDPAQDGDDREWLEEFSRLLDRAVRRRWTQRSVLSLSGGYDSRCLALSLLRQRASPTAVSYGMAGSEDLTLGTEVARRAELRHRALLLRPGYLAEYAPEAVWLFDGRFRCLACHHLVLRPLRETGAEAIMIGFGGDDALRLVKRPPAGQDEASFARSAHLLRASCVTDALLGTLLTPDFAAELRGRAAAGIAEALRNDEGGPAARWAQFLFRNTQAPTLFEDHFAARDPFIDHALIDFARTLPLRLRAEGRLQRLYLRSHRGLAALRIADGRPRPSVEGVRFRGEVVAGGLRRRLLPRAHASWNRGTGSYARDLRRGSRRLAEVLLEPRTLERGQLRERGVRTLIAQTMSGENNDTRALGMLLTLELFQREFIDGDGFESGEQLLDAGAAAVAPVTA